MHSYKHTSISSVELKAGVYIRGNFTCTFELLVRSALLQRSVYIYRGVEASGHRPVDFGVRRIKKADGHQKRGAVS